jgi:hypothetical protein
MSALCVQALLYLEGLFYIGFINLSVKPLSL